MVPLRRIGDGWRILAGSGAIQAFGRSSSPKNARIDRCGYAVADLEILPPLYGKPCIVQALFAVVVLGRSDADRRPHKSDSARGAGGRPNRERQWLVRTDPEPSARRLFRPPGEGPFAWRERIVGPECSAIARQLPQPNRALASWLVRGALPCWCRSARHGRRRKISQDQRGCDEADMPIGRVTAGRYRGATYLRGNPSSGRCVVFRALGGGGVARAPGADPAVSAPSSYSQPAVAAMPTTSQSGLRAHR